MVAARRSTQYSPGIPFHSNISKLPSSLLPGLELRPKKIVMELSPNFMRKLPYYVCRANDNRSAAHVNVRLGKNLQHTSGLKLPPPKKKIAESILAIPPTPPESPNQPLELYATVLKVHVHTCRLQQQLLADFSW